MRKLSSRAESGLVHEQCPGSVLTLPHCVLKDVLPVPRLKATDAELTLLAGLRPLSSGHLRASLCVPEGGFSPVSRDPLE